jgi:propanol-preferring alcohol dehydrogenase
LELARGVVRSMGDVTIVGIAGGEIPVSFFSQPYEVSIATTYWGSRPELAELLALAASGQISAERSIYSLEHGARAYRDLRDNLVTGRAVVVP